MSLSSCEKCWDTPCGCGHEWRNASTDGMVKHILSIISKHNISIKLEVISKVHEQVIEEVRGSNTNPNP